VTRAVAKGIVASLILLLLAACAAAPPRGVATLVPERFADLAGWTEDQQDAALTALARSCARLLDLPADRRLGPPGFGTAGLWAVPCRALPGQTDTLGARAYFERYFLPVAIRDGDAADGLFTGYYEPVLAGSRQRDGHHATPLLAPPPDLVTVELGQFREAWRGERVAGRVFDGRLRPYENRAEIVAGRLGTRAVPIAWAADPVDAFFLQIQGSGRVALAEGGELRLGYAAQNGHRYVPIGRVLVERGALAPEAVSMQSIRAWLAANPAEAAAVMNANPSYVFFRIIDEPGPLGSEGVALTPGRSLAVDRAHLPLGVPVWLDAEDPLDPERRLRRLMVAQDTGGAIRGVVRGDVFWGDGAEAEARAGRMRARGRYWVLLPRDLAAAGAERH
jgi:membrane-bound lytic murein transglycosylase A